MHLTLHSAGVTAASAGQEPARVAETRCGAYRTAAAPARHAARTSYAMKPLPHAMPVPKAGQGMAAKCTAPMTHARS